MSQLVRHDWTIAEVEALFALPFGDLMFRAQDIHRAHHPPNAVQMSTLLSIKTGACPEDCAYCPQSVRYDTGLEREKLVPLDEVRSRAQAAKDLNDPEYQKAKAEAQRLAGPEGIGKLLADDRLDALIAPTVSPAWMTDVVLGDQVPGGTGGLSAIAGWPHLTVPMGQVRGLPVGISFMGPAWSEARLLGYGYAFEQATRARRPPTYQPHVIEPRPDR